MPTSLVSLLAVKPRYVSFPLLIGAMSQLELTVSQDGFTVILVERGEGVETKPIKTSYSASAGTAYITFDKVKVPVENTLGQEGGGIFVMLGNFNHERWVMCCASARSQRMLIDECMK